MALSMGSWNKRADNQGVFCEEMGEDSSGSWRKEMKCKELNEVKPSFVELAGCEGFESMMIDSFLSLSSALSRSAFGHSNCFFSL
jgi:hypothetical protein